VSSSAPDVRITWVPGPDEDGEQSLPDPARLALWNGVR
jgi:hypothetical protein